MFYIFSINIWPSDIFLSILIFVMEIKKAWLCFFFFCFFIKKPFFFSRLNLKFLCSLRKSDSRVISIKHGVIFRKEHITKDPSRSLRFRYVQRHKSSCASLHAIDSLSVGVVFTVKSFGHHVVLGSEGVVDSIDDEGDWWKLIFVGAVLSNLKSIYEWMMRI